MLHIICMANGNNRTKIKNRKFLEQITHLSSCFLFSQSVFIEGEGLDAVAQFIFILVFLFLRLRPHCPGHIALGTYTLFLIFWWIYTLAGKIHLARLPWAHWRVPRKSPIRLDLTFWPRELLLFFLHCCPHLPPQLVKYHVHVQYHVHLVYKCCSF